MHAVFGLTVFSLTVSFVIFAHKLRQVYPNLRLLHSSIWWMVALRTPSSTTSGDLFSTFKVAIKRPSEVPPVVESSVSVPVTALIADWQAPTRLPCGVKMGCLIISNWCDNWLHRLENAYQKIAWVVALSFSSLVSVEKRKLNSALKVAGITLLAPVPAWRLEICRVVAGKYALPLSQVWLQSSDRAGKA